MCLQHERCGFDPRLSLCTTKGGSILTNERVTFRLIQMPCCKHQLCWVNPRLPSYCPECGDVLLGYRLGESILITDDKAVLQLTGGPIGAT